MSPLVLFVQVSSLPVTSWFSQPIPDTLTEDYVKQVFVEACAARNSKTFTEAMKLVRRLCVAVCCLPKGRCRRHCSSVVAVVLGLLLTALDFATVRAALEGAVRNPVLHPSVGRREATPAARGQ